MRWESTAQRRSDRISGSEVATRLPARGLKIVLRIIVIRRIIDSIKAAVIPLLRAHNLEREPVPGLVQCEAWWRDDLLHQLVSLSTRNLGNAARHLPFALHH